MFNPSMPESTIRNSWLVVGEDDLNRMTNDKYIVFIKTDLRNRS